MEKLIHILFDPQGAAVLQKSFGLDDIIEGEIVVMEEDLSAGPLSAPDTGNGAMSREQWRSLLHGGEARDTGDAGKLAEVVRQLQSDENTETWIWAAQNARDVCGYYALTATLEPLRGRVHIIYLNNLPFINDKGAIFYPGQLGTIPPKEFLKARKLAREITASEFEIDREEWNRLVAENRPLRILEGGKKISGQDAEFFDKELLANVAKDFQKAFRVITHFRHKAKHVVGEDYLLWRLKEMARSGMIEHRGELTGARDFDVKIKNDDQDTAA